MAAPQSVSVKLLCALLLLAAGLGALLYFKPGKDEGPAYPISNVTADAVTNVIIERPGKDAVALELAGGKWRMSAPFAARADAAQVENLLSLSNAKSSVRYAQTDLARFDLEAPLLKVNINDQEILFGGINPLSGEQYIAAQGYVYLVSPRYGSAAQSESWVSRKLLTEDEEPVRFEFPGFTVGKSADQWTVTPRAGELSQQDFTVWLNRWRLATSLSSAPATPAEGARFKITLADGREIPMLAREKDSEFFFVRENVQYQFSPAVAKPLVEPPAPTTK